MRFASEGRGSYGKHRVIDIAAEPLIVPERITALYKNLSLSKFYLKYQVMWKMYKKSYISRICMLYPTISVGKQDVKNDR